MSSKKSKVTVNSHHNDVTVNIMMNDKKLEEVHSFKYLGSVITKDDCSDKDIRARIGQATAALIHLDTTWKTTPCALRLN